MVDVISGLSLVSGALLVLFLSSIGMFSLLRFRKSAPWLLFIMLPIIIAYMLFHIPEWFGADPAEYYSWEIIIITTWSAPAVIGYIVYMRYAGREKKN